MEKLKYFTNNRFTESAADKFYKVYDPSTGEHIADCPRLTLDEVKQVIANAEKAYPAWADTPVKNRVQILYKVKQLIEKTSRSLPCWWQKSMARYTRRQRAMS